MAQAVYDKIGSCPVGLARESDLMSACAPCIYEYPATPRARDPDAVAFQFDSFADMNRMLGSKINLAPSEILGRLCGLNGTADYLARAVGARRDDVAQNLRWLAGQGSASQREDAQFWFDEYLAVIDPATNRGREISGTPCWLFLGEAGHHARAMLQSTDRIDLPCRLGLPSFLPYQPSLPPVEFLGFAIEAHRVRNARAPSVFDGDYESVKEVWSPAGVTQPLHWGPIECTAKSGLREIVAASPSYDEIEPNIFVFWSRVH
jgi:predicted transcriptional regulator